MPLVACTNHEPACHSNKKLLGRVAFGFRMAVLATSDLSDGITFPGFCSRDHWFDGSCLEQAKYTVLCQLRALKLLLDEAFGTHL